MWVDMMAFYLWHSITHLGPILCMDDKNKSFSDISQDNSTNMFPVQISVTSTTKMTPFIVLATAFTWTRIVRTNLTLSAPSRISALLSVTPSSSTSSGIIDPRRCLTLCTDISCRTETWSTEMIWVSRRYEFLYGRLLHGFLATFLLFSQLEPFPFSLL